MVEEDSTSSTLVISNDCGFLPGLTPGQHLAGVSINMQKFIGSCKSLPGLGKATVSTKPFVFEVYQTIKTGLMG